MKKKTKNFKSNFSWTFLGNVLYAISQWLIIVLMVNIGDAEMVGQYSLGLAITAPIVLFFNLQMRSILATDTNNQYNYGEYFGSRIVYQFFALLLIVVLSIIGTYEFSLLLIIILVGIAKVVESFSELSHGYLQKIERMDYAGKSQIIKAFVSVITVGVLLYLFENLTIALLGLIFAWVVRLIFYDLRIVNNYTAVRPKFNKTIKSIFIFAFPLGLVSIINSLNSNIPRYFLEYYIGIEELGYFSAIAYILVAGNLLIKPLSLVAAPRLAKFYNSNNVKSFLRLNIFLMIFSLTIGIVILIITYFFGELILTLVYNSDYAAYSELLIIIMFGSVLSFFTTFLNISIVAARKFKIQPVINFITTITAVLSSVYLIPSLGIKGAAYVLLVVYSTQFFCSLILFITVIIRMMRK